MPRRVWLTAVALAASGLIGEAGAYEGIVEKKVFELPRYTTHTGAVLEQVRVGWESYGTLNRDRSNAILVTHYFSATSHAAGGTAWEAVPC